MGQMTRDKVLAILRRDNPGCGADDIAMYADCFLDYQEAQANIEKNGNIVSHPRTASPIENPYIKVKASAMNQIRKITKIRRVDALWTGKG